MLTTDELSELFQKVRAYLLREGREHLEVYGPNPKGGTARQFDRHAEDLIIEYFSTRSHRVRIISEERREPVFIGESPYEYTLICDPVDGSDNYLYGYQVVAFAVAVVPGSLPVTPDNVCCSLVGEIYSNNVFTAQKGRGAFLNGRKLPQLDAGNVCLGDSLITVDFDPGDKKNTKNAERGLKIVEMAAGQRRTGSTCWDLCWLARGSLRTVIDLRKELSAENFLAPFGIVREVGCVLTDEHGNDLGKRDFSDLSKRYNIICAASRELIDEIVSAIQ